MPQTILGIDIGSYSIKAALLERSLKAFRFIQFYERRIQYNDLLSPEESVAVTLQGMVDDFQLKADQIICGYPANQVSSRLLTLPFGNLAKIDQSLEFELEGYIPFDLESLVLDYHVVRSAKESSDVLAVYSIKAPFADWLKRLQNSGIDPKIVTVESSEFLNLVCLGMVPPEGPYAILDIGHAKTNLVIGHGKQLGLLRSIAFGGKDLTERIAKKMGVPMEEAERLKVEMGSLRIDEQETIDDLSKQVGEAIQEAMEDLLVNIRQALFSFRDQFGAPVEGFYLCGGTSRLPHLDRFLSIRLKQNVTFLDCTTFHFTQLEKVSAHRVVMPQALALALRGVASARMPRFNFRYEALAFKGDVEKIGGTIRHVAIAAGLIFALGLSYFGIKFVVLSKRVQALNNQITQTVKTVLPELPRKLESPSQALRLIKSEENKIRDRTGKLTAIQGLSILDFLKEVSERVPSGEEIKLDIEDLNIKGGRVSLSGVVDSFEAPDKIKTALEKSKYMKKVTKGNVRKGVKPDEVKFEMTMDLL